MNIIRAFFMVGITLLKRIQNKQTAERNVYLFATSPGTVLPYMLYNIIIESLIVVRFLYIAALFQIA